ncbi:MAG: D-amino acid dehydrogenase [Pseudomonadota bacterium]
MHVCVVGAGIVGLATAYTLERAGHQVTVVDRGPPGEGASGGNGAQLSYAYVQPLAEPSVWAQLPRLLFSAQSPLTLRLQRDPRQWRWMVEFMRACRRSVADETTGQLLALAAESRIGFERMRRDLSPACDYSASGKLVLYRDRSALDAAARQVLLQRSLGSVQRVVTAAECAELEPALTGYAAHIAGAVYTPGECAADCLKVCQALSEGLRSRGVELLYHGEVSAWRVGRGRVTAVTTAFGEINADCFVVAAGAASVRMGRALGVRLPVYPLKGYSTTLDLGECAGTVPTISVTDSAAKVVFAPLGRRLRVAGMAELVGEDLRIDPRRIRQLRQTTAAVFPQLGALRESGSWAGLRPATPTGRPIVGRLPRAPENVFFNTGHGALGFTLAFGTAARLLQAIEHGAAGR